jgi:hypothetical protein
MTMTPFNYFAATLGLALAMSLPAAAQAQSTDFDAAFAPRGAEARISLSIPLGGDMKSAKSKPQLALIGRQYRSDRGAANWAIKSAGAGERYTESRLAMTLSSQPQFLFNDAVLQLPQSEREDIGTAGRVGLGVGAIVLATVTVVSVLVLACSADDDCFEGPYDE